MPSFLNKVFGYKKHDDKEPSRSSREASDNTLLDGKYEAISPISPSAISFAEAQASRDTDREVGFSLFRPKSRGVSQKPAQKRPEAVPQLTLHLPGPKESLDSRTFGVAFEPDPDSHLVLDDAIIGAKRLNPLEALILIRACAQAINERGLETLGIMHPHWFSASPDVQRRLISLFIRSLAPQSHITTLSPTPTSAAATFENELHYTRSPHDVAAVLRWGLRHLSFENGSFGKEPAEWGWYNAFFNAERDASYPPGGFSQLLIPQLPASHVELLVSTLSLISSLASHAESNSISGSKLSKFLGIWLLTATRSEKSDDWERFYARWERAGRILEHLFLARLREESFAQRLPTRLQELVKYYPYNKDSPVTEQGLLSKPRFSTVQFDALYVRVETVLTRSADQPRQHPIQLVVEALQLSTSNLPADEYTELWNAIKNASSEADSESSTAEVLQFTRIFSDETIKLLSLIPADSSVPTSPILLTSPILSPKRSSSSLTKIIERAASSPRKGNSSAAGSLASPVTPMITDWAQFSVSGFGETPATQSLSALLDQDDDVEVTQPQVSRKSSRKHGMSRTRRKRSEDNDLSATPSTQQLSEVEPAIVETKLSSLHIVQIDEAFIDFWSDAILDPVSADWPLFVVCGLKVIPSVDKRVRWLVIEQIYSREAPSPPPREPSPEVGARGRSPRPSFRSDISGFRISNMFSSTRKRFSVFSKSATDLTPRKSTGKSPQVGELGEILAEEEPSTPSRIAEGSTRVQVTTATPSVVNGAISTTMEQGHAELSISAEMSASASDAPTATPAPEVEQHTKEPSPSFEITPPTLPGDLTAKLEPIHTSGEASSTAVEVATQSDPERTPASDPVQIVDGSLVIVAPSPAAQESSAVTQETTKAQLPDLLADTSIAVVEAVPVIEDKEADPVVDETETQAVVETPVQAPPVAAAEEIGESVVLGENTLAPHVVAETSVLPDQAEKLLQEAVTALEPVAIPAVEPFVAPPEDKVEAEDLPSEQDEAVAEAEASSTPDAVEAPRDIGQVAEVATPVPETVTLVEETPIQEPGVDATQPEAVPEPEHVVEETTEVAVEEEPQVVLAPSAEELPVEIIASEPEVATDATAEVQAPVETDSSQETVVEEPSVEVAPAAINAEEPVEVAPEAAAEPEPVVDEAPVIEEVQVLVEEEVSQDVVQPAEEPSVAEPEAANNSSPAAEDVVEEAEVQVVPESTPAVDTEPETPVEDAVEPLVEETQAPSEAEEPTSAVVDTIEPTIVAEPELEHVEVEATEPIAEEEPASVVAEEVAASEPVIDVSEPAVAVEPEPVEDKVAEPLVEEEGTLVEAVEPLVESVLVKDDSEDAPPPVPEQEETAAEPEPQLISPEAKTVDEPLEEIHESGPASSAPEPSIVVEDDAVETNEASEEPIYPPEAIPSQESETTVPEAAEVVEEPTFEAGPEQVDAQPEAVQPEPEAAPFVEDDDIDIPPSESLAPATDATPEEA